MTSKTSLLDELKKDMSKYLQIPDNLKHMLSRLRKSKVTFVYTSYRLDFVMSVIQHVFRDDDYKKYL